MFPNKKIKFLKNPFFILFVLTLFAGLLRFWHFTSNPPSLYVDEVSHGYNAYSILKTARDEYGTFMPFFVRSFNTYNPPLAIYTLVPTIFLFGLNEFGVRISAVFFGTLFIPLMYFFVKKLISSTQIALLSSFFVTVSLWHIHFSRFYHESGLTLFFCVLGVTLFLYAKQKPLTYILSALSFGVAINYSHGAKIFVPLLIIIMILFLWNRTIKNLNYIIAATIILVISVLPHVINTEKSLARAQPVSIFSNDVGNKREKFIDGYLSHYSGRFLFIRGDYQGRHSVPGMGELYIFEIPLIMFGLYALIKSKEKNHRFILFWILVGPIPAALSIPTPHAGRALILVPAFAITSALGLIYIFNNFRKIFLVPLIFIALYNFVTYIHLYHNHYPKEKAVDWADGYKELSQFLGENYNNYERIAVTRYWGHPYIYVLFYTKFDPAKYHSQSENKYAFDKYEFYLGAPEPSDKKTLFVSTAEHQGNIKKEIDLNNGDLFFVVHE